MFNKHCTKVYCCAPQSLNSKMLALERTEVPIINFWLNWLLIYWNLGLGVVAKGLISKIKFDVLTTTLQWSFWHRKDSGKSVNELRLGPRSHSKGRLLKLYCFQTLPASSAWPIVTNLIPLDTRKKVYASFWYCYLNNCQSLIIVY